MQDRCVLLYNQQLPQSAFGSKTPVQAMKDWHTLRLDLFRQQPYHLLGCDTYAVAFRTTNRADNALKDALPTEKPAFDE